MQGYCCGGRGRASGASGVAWSSLAGFVRSALASGVCSSQKFGAAGAVRGLAAARRQKRKKKLDEYEVYDGPVRGKVWRELQQGGGIIGSSFIDMTAKDLATAVYVASKMTVSSDHFWSRAGLALGDVASVMNRKQLALTSHALGIARWNDEFVLRALQPALVRAAPELRPGDLAVIIRALGNLEVRHTPTLTALASAVQGSESMKSKGLCMVLESFAKIRFQSDAVLQRLDGLADATRLQSLPVEEVVSLLRSLALLERLPQDDVQGFRSSNGTGKHHGRQGFRALCERAISATGGDRGGGTAGALAPTMLSPVVIAICKLMRVFAHEDGKTLLKEDALLYGRVVETLEKAVGYSVHVLPISSLAALLDSFAHMYTLLAPPGEQMQMQAQRRRLLSQLCGRLSHSLPNLRPQDSCRAVQALDRIGLMDPYLASGVHSGVPAQLQVRSAVDLVSMLKSYARGRNADPFMIRSLRRALVPLVLEEQSGGPGAGDAALAKQEGSRSLLFFDTALLDQLDDTAVAEVANLFQSLHAPEGVLVLVAALQQSSRALAACCDFAVASTLESLLSISSWNGMVATLVAEEGSEVGPQMAEHLQEIFTAEMCAAWQRKADAGQIQADTLGLAALTFLGHNMRRHWLSCLQKRLSECSLYLLPALAGLADRAVEVDEQEYLDVFRTAVARELVERLLLSIAQSGRQSDDDEEMTGTAAPLSRSQHAKRRKQDEDMHIDQVAMANGPNPSQLPLPEIPQFNLVLCKELPSAAPTVAALRVLAEQHARQQEAFFPTSEAPEGVGAAIPLHQLQGAAVALAEHLTAILVSSEVVEAQGEQAAALDRGRSRSGRCGAKDLARALHCLRQLEFEQLPPLFVRHLAEAASAGELTPKEFLACLRNSLTRQAVNDKAAAPARELLSKHAARVMAVLQSSKQAWELEALGRSLKLDLTPAPDFDALNDNDAQLEEETSR